MPAYKYLEVQSNTYSLSTNIKHPERLMQKVRVFLLRSSMHDVKDDAMLCPRLFLCYTTIRYTTEISTAPAFHATSQFTLPYGPDFSSFVSCQMIRRLCITRHNRRLPSLVGVRRRRQRQATQEDSCHQTEARRQGNIEYESRCAFLGARG